MRRSVPARCARRADERRLEIVRAAARVFRRRGFTAAGMREIAQEADLSPANLYHYFKGKDEVLYFCQDRSLELMVAALERSKRSACSASDKVRGVIEAHVMCLLDELEGSVAHLEMGALPPSLRGRLVAKRDGYERGVRRLIQAGVRRGEFGPCDPALVTRAILGAANWTARWFRPDGPAPAARVASELAAFLVRGLAPTMGAQARRLGAEAPWRVGPKMAAASQGTRHTAVVAQDPLRRGTSDRPLQPARQGRRVSRTAARD